MIEKQTEDKYRFYLKATIGEKEILFTLEKDGTLNPDDFYSFGGIIFFETDEGLDLINVLLKNNYPINIEKTMKSLKINKDKVIYQAETTGENELTIQKAVSITKCDIGERKETQICIMVNDTPAFISIEEARGLSKLLAHI